jgi:hypothetical protein
VDSAQFKKWLSNHTKRFNSIEAWLNKKPETPGGEATAKEIIEAWFQVLADVRIDDAIWATEQMFKGDLAQPQGPGFDDHPRTVRRYALERAKGRSGRKRGPGWHVPARLPVLRRHGLCHDLVPAVSWK